MCRTSTALKLAEEQIPQRTTGKTLREEIFASMLDSDNEDHIASYHSSRAGTLSDFHDNPNIPEIEIISLLEEKIPLYTLRADTTSHYPYDHSDWLRTLPGSTSGYDENEEDYDLSPEMMEETLKYFTLCGERVVQMTKTYHDIEAVTKLLEEKEKDLELAAKIGQTLLDQNKKFETRIEELEEQVTVIDDSNTQLRHDLKLKKDLLKFYTNDPEYSDSDEEYQSDKKSLPQYIKVDSLQRKVSKLEEENFGMRIEVANMRDTTTCLEEKEEQLMRGFFKELGETKGSNSVLMEELSKKLEENFRQQEEITLLLTDLVDTQQKVKRLAVENDEYQHHLTAAKEAQLELTEEIQILREKYEECMTMLREEQERNKERTKNAVPYAGGLGNFNVMNPLPVFPADSLAAELVGSLEQEMGGDPFLSKEGKRQYNRSVMQTVNAVNKRSFLSRPGSGYNSDYQITGPTSPASSVLSLPGTPHSELYEGDNELESIAGSSMKSAPRRIPGSNDLETALKRLQLRRQNEEAERKYHDSHASVGSGQQTPTCPTPDSFMSSLSGISGGGLGGFRSYMPEKLQIIKPMEGSLTLHHWQRLATPHMASMLDQRPGVMVKGFREIDHGNEVYSLGDIEDDGQIIGTTIPSKCFVNTSSTYTYTNCNIGILDDSIMTMSTQSNARMSTILQPRSQTNLSSATRTFSTSLGLAQVLQERNTNDTAAIKTKAELGANVQLKQSSVGLNFLSSSTDSEKRSEQPVSAPSGVHQVTGGIFSRNAAPVTSKGTKITSMDKETKQRLLQKVKSIRESKCSTTNALVMAPSRALSIPVTRNLGYSMSTMVYGSPSRSRPISSSIPLTSLTSSCRMSPSVSLSSSSRMSPSVSLPSSSRMSPSVSLPSSSRMSPSVSLSSSSIMSPSVSLPSSSRMSPSVSLSSSSRMSPSLALTSTCSMAPSLALTSSSRMSPSVAVSTQASTPPSAMGQGLNFFTSPMSLMAGISGIHKGNPTPTSKS